MDVARAFREEMARKRFGRQRIVDRHDIMPASGRRKDDIAVEQHDGYLRPADDGHDVRVPRVVCRQELDRMVDHSRDAPLDEVGRKLADVVEQLLRLRRVNVHEQERAVLTLRDPNEFQGNRIEILVARDSRQNQPERLHFGALRHEDALPLTATHKPLMPKLVHRLSHRRARTSATAGELHLAGEGA